MSEDGCDVVYGVDRLDRSIGKANARLAGIDAGPGTSDRRLAYCVLQAWLSNLQDRMARRHMLTGSASVRLAARRCAGTAEPGAGEPTAAGPSARRPAAGGRR